MARRKKYHIPWKKYGRTLYSAQWKTKEQTLAINLYKRKWEVVAVIVLDDREIGHYAFRMDLFEPPDTFHEASRCALSYLRAIGWKPPYDVKKTESR